MGQEYYEKKEGHLITNNERGLRVTKYCPRCDYVWLTLTTLLSLLLLLLVEVGLRAQNAI
jgi:hypothetical protein